MPRRKSFPFKVGGSLADLCSRQVDGDLDVQGGLAMGAKWVALRPRIIRPMGESSCGQMLYDLWESIGID
jgi:hypothetical protein